MILSSLPSTVTVTGGKVTESGPVGTATESLQLTWALVVPLANEPLSSRPSGPIPSPMSIEVGRPKPRPELFQVAWALAEILAVWPGVTVCGKVKLTVPFMVA